MSATDALFARAFSCKALITAKEAAPLLGVDEKTVSALAEGGALRFVKIGAGKRSKRYAEADLRAFLSHETELSECQSTNRRRALTGNTTSSTRVVGITDLRAKRLSQKRRL